MRLYVLLLLVLVCTVALVSSSSETEEEGVDRYERDDEAISRDGERGLGKFFKKVVKKMKKKIKKMIHKAITGGSKKQVTEEAKEIKAEIKGLPEEDKEQVEGYAVHKAEEAASGRYRRVESREDRIRRRNIFHKIVGVVKGIFG